MRSSDEEAGEESAEAIGAASLSPMTSAPGAGGPEEGDEADEGGGDGHGFGSDGRLTAPSWTACQRSCLLRMRPQAEAAGR